MRRPSPRRRHGRSRGAASRSRIGCDSSSAGTGGPHEKQVWLSRGSRVSVRARIDESPCRQRRHEARSAARHSQAAPSGESAARVTRSRRRRSTTPTTPTTGEVTSPGKYPPTRIENEGCATPFATQPAPRNQIGNKVALCRTPNPQTDAPKIASQATLNDTKNPSGIWSSPNRAGNRSWNPVSSSSVKCVP